MTTDGLESPVMDSFPSPLPNSQLPSGILLTFFWFGPNLLGLVSPSRFQISCGHCHDKNHEPRDIHPELSHGHGLYHTGIYFTTQRDSFRTHDTFTRDPENSHCRTHGEETEGGPGIPPDHCHRGLWKRMLLQQRLTDPGLALVTNTSCF